MRFDRDRPYATVFGQPGVMYQQAGHYYNAGGAEVDEHGASVQIAAPVVIEDVPDPVRRDDLRVRGNRELKAMLDVYGEPWTTAENARAFLAGKGEM